uniref:E3 ubiquitin-protein ligase n=1 Tax=Blastobotrys adeninivorans TaxID=409370 RepID=A0A060T6C4_BLAAD
MSSVQSLREYLVQAPRLFDCRYNGQAARDLRRALFKSATVDGKYIDLFFTNMDPARARTLVNAGATGQAQEGESDDSDVEMGDGDEQLNQPVEWILKDPLESHVDPAHPGRPCVRKFKKGEPTYRCLTCGLDETCVLCQYCYNSDDHVGHQVTFSISQQDCGGVCDCGDPEAWVNKFSCKYHTLENYDNNPLPEEFHDAIEKTVEAALDYVIDVFAGAHTGIQKFKTGYEVRENEATSRLSEKVYGVKDDYFNGKYILSLWNDQKHSFKDALNVILRATHKKRRFGEMVTKRIDAVGRGTVIISSDLPDLISKKLKMEDTGLVNTVRTTKDHFREEMAGTIIEWIEDLSKSPVNGNYLVLRDIIAKALTGNWNYGTDILVSKTWPRPIYSPQFKNATLMDIHASLDGFRIPDPGDHTQMTTPAEQLPSFMAPSSSRQAYDAEARDHTYYEEQEPDMETQSIGSSSSAGGQPELSIFGDDHWDCDPLGGAREHDVTNARVQYLIFFDVRLWKQLRLTLRDLYISVLVSHSEYKIRLGHLYAQLYPQVAELYALADREPECSIISSLSTQLFTAPSIATDLVKYDYYTHFMAALYTFFTNCEIGSPRAVSNRGYILMESRMLRNRRFGQLFHDIEYMLNRNTEKALISGNIDRIRQAADFILLFQGQSPIRRHVIKHVEYESDVWISFFNAMPYVLQLGEIIAQGFEDCTSNDSEAAIALVSDLAALWAFGHYTDRFQAGEVKKAPEFHISSIDFPHMELLSEMETTRASTIDYDIKTNQVSLHHPLHAFLSWVIQHSKVETAAQLRQLLLPSDAEVATHFSSRWSDDQVLLAMFDYPIRVLSLLTQIQVGLWVRNGYSVRTQLHHYREATLRDYAFRRDVFMVQTALVVIDPAIVLLELMERFEISSLDNFDDETIDKSKKLYIVEEFLRYLIGLLMERTNLQRTNDKETKRQYIRKEIIQCLAFKDLTFSEMCRSIPDALSSEAVFETVLNELATFKPPSGVRDYGMYQLKPEFYSEFDTHYIHFSSTRIEEAETVIKNRLHKQTGTPIEAIVVEPPIRKIDSGPYVKLSAFTRTLPFVRMTYDLLVRVYQNYSDNQHEGVLNYLLHLLHVAALDDLNMDSDKSLAHYLCLNLFDPLDETAEESQSIVQLLLVFMKKDEFKDCRAKIQRILSILREKDSTLMESVVKDGSIGTQEEMDDSISVSATESEFKKKQRIGKERQQKILQQLQEQQKLFAQNNMGQDDDDMDLEEEGDASESENIPGWKYPESQCILCRMPDDKSTVFGTVGYAMYTNVFRDVPFQKSDWVYEAFGSSKNLDTDNTLDDINKGGNEKWQQYRKQYNEEYTIGPGFPTEHSNRRVVVNSCGHGMHYHCYKDYAKNGRNRGLQFTRNTPEDQSKGEFLCPLCKSINNLFIPRLWKNNNRSLDDLLQENSTFEQYYNKLHFLIDQGFFSDNLRYRMLDDKIVTEGSKHISPTFAEALEYNCESADPSNNRLGTDAYEALTSVMFRVVDVKIAEGLDRVEHPMNVLSNIDMLANTISSLEVSLRGVKHSNPMGGLIIDQIPTQALNCIRGHAELCKCWLGYLTAIGKGGKQTSQPESPGLSRDLSPLELTDMNFEHLVYNLFITGPGGGLDTLHLIKTYYMGVVTNVLLRLVKEVNERADWTTDPILFEMPLNGEPSEESLRALSDIVGFIRSVVEVKSIPETYIWNKASFVKIMYSMVLKSVTVFLRKVSIAVYALCGVGYDPYDFMGFGDVPEADKLCEFLRLPTLSELLVQIVSDGSAEKKLFMDWAASSSSPFVSRPPSQNKVEYPGVVRLLKLPHRLDEFFNLTNHLKESKLKELPADPAVCLFCGITMKLQASPFGDDSRGECQLHMLKCGRDLGIYLLPKRSAVLLLRGRQGSFIEGPYLDLHGEADETLRRGRPQFLQNNRYDYFTKTYWQQHGLPSYIARKLDSVVDIGGWETL